MADLGRPEGVAAEEEITRLRTENAHLLDELEMAYLQMERALDAADYETRITYAELKGRNEELQRRLEDLEHANGQLQQAQSMLK